MNSRNGINDYSDQILWTKYHQADKLLSIFNDIRWYWSYEPAWYYQGWPDYLSFQLGYQ